MERIPPRIRSVSLLLVPLVPCFGPDHKKQGPHDTLVILARKPSSKAIFRQRSFHCTLNKFVKQITLWKQRHANIPRVSFAALDPKSQAKLMSQQAPPGPHSHMDAIESMRQSSNPLPIGCKGSGLIRGGGRGATVVVNGLWQQKLSVQPLFFKGKSLTKEFGGFWRFGALVGVVPSLHH